MELEEKIKLIRALRDMSLDAALKYKTYNPKDPAYQTCLELANALTIAIDIITPKDPAYQTCLELANALTIAIDIITNDGHAEEVIKGFTKEARKKK